MIVLTCIGRQLDHGRSLLENPPAAIQHEMVVRNNISERDG